MGTVIEKILPYCNFALAIAGLVVRVFLRPDSRKATILGIVIIFMVVMTGVGAFQAINHERLVDATSREIITVLASDTRTFDQISQALYKPDLRVATEALDDLVKTKIVGHQMLDVRDDIGRRFSVRGYYLLAIDTKQ